jgi:omega-6 fatty acid desaturase (delta-12 desaturase)
MGKIKNDIQDEDKMWQKIIMKYNIPDHRKSIWQIINSVVPYALTWYLLYRSLEYPYWVTILLSLLAAGFMIREVLAMYGR